MRKLKEYELPVFVCMMLVGVLGLVLLHVRQHDEYVDGIQEFARERLEDMDRLRPGVNQPWDFARFYRQSVVPDPAASPPPFVRESLVLPDPLPLSQPEDEKKKNDKGVGDVDLGLGLLGAGEAKTVEAKQNHRVLL